MDLDEWEFIPDEGFLEIHDDDGNRIFSRNFLDEKDDPSSMINLNYFPDPQFVDSTEESKTLDQEPVKQIIETPISRIEIPEPEIGAGLQVFLENSEEDQENQEFVEMKSMEAEEKFDLDQEKDDEERLNIWKWGLNGIGRFCSLGVAAATICIVVLGNGKHGHHKIDFQFYPDDVKRNERKTKMREAISAAREVPWNRAHIRYGGYINAN